ncbi:hypothetical protein CONCODRAFT_9877 [Conidiobolus coronatus NRRL 28638]|uniref:Galactose oxidase n=1 Tax=Conidiobolus coronatus (strain ATCC 28846 / CBS 209.66 / NRRL 28638) TaxID=796925 RepID=A0A137NYS2_CONC2|nr:hypothetical protein CONCODRAFT_9877 [Conidiobolus coronatus NRRL 28638]|eukprot:KXN67980.1 hypothetical protein CONCODRAFT_9877 [Conidiobolus coronatus NRRL 28638]
MDLRELNFTKRYFKSDMAMYNNYLLGHSTGKYVNGESYWLLELIGDKFITNPSSDIIDFSKIPGGAEVTFIPFEYPNPENKILLAYGVSASTTYVSSFTNPLKNSIDLSGQNINNNGPGQRLGITLLKSNSNLWAFGGYPVKGGTESAVSGYFFLFNSTSNKWVDKTDLAIKANIPNLIYHTMTNINDEYLIIIGGGTYNTQGILVDKPFDKAYKFDLSKETWSSTSLDIQRQWSMEI